MNFGDCQQIYGSIKKKRSEELDSDDGYKCVGNSGSRVDICNNLGHGYSLWYGWKFEEKKNPHKKLISHS